MLLGPNGVNIRGDKIFPRVFAEQNNVFLYIIMPLGENPAGIFLVSRRRRRRIRHERATCATRLFPLEFLRLYIGVWIIYHCRRIVMINVLGTYLTFQKQRKFYSDRNLKETFDICYYPVGF